MSAANSTPPPQPRKHSWLVWLLIGCLAIGLTVAWFPLLWQGGGLVGGDIYSYCFPQKQYLSEQLRQREWPWWNPRTGHGYPALAESQTGILYPPNWVYAVLPVNTAYVAVQLAHYALAFAGCVLFARVRGSRWCGALLLALVYTYAWLPPKVSVEWAAIGAAWLPIVCWLLECHLRSGRWRGLLAVSLILAVQIFAGHFQLAFLTQLMAGCYWSWRLGWDRTQLHPAVLQAPFRTWLMGVFCFALAFGLAAIQLLSTWELKQLSQRAVLGGEHDPNYGYLPWWYLPQLIAPWMYYGQGVSFAVPGPRTNATEAHLYVGILPLLLACWAMVSQFQQRNRDLLAWTMLVGISILIATGTVMPVLQMLPGFGFFNGSGRYSLLTTFALAILAAAGWEQLTTRWTSRFRAIGCVMLCLVTWFDLQWVARQVAVSIVVPNPPLVALESSEIRRLLQTQDRPPRLFAPGANLPNLLGVSATPVYLGLSPGLYFDPQWMLPQPWPYDTPATAEQIDWFRRAGVTHVLSFHPLEPQSWPIRLLTATPDSFLNSAWGRGPRELIYLYELKEAPGRLRWVEEGTESPLEDSATITAEITAERSTYIEIKTSHSQTATLVLADLDWPGWEVTLDGQPAHKQRLPGMERAFRSVRVPPGEHSVLWKYQPRSLQQGMFISGISLLIWAAIAHVCFWHPNWLQRVRHPNTH